MYDGESLSDSSWSFAEAYGNYGDATGSGAAPEGSSGSGWSSLLDKTIPALIGAWVQHDQAELQAKRYSETDDPEYRYAPAPQAPAQNQMLVMAAIGVGVLVLVVVLARK